MSKTSLLVIPTLLLSLASPLLNVVVKADVNGASKEQIKKVDDSKSREDYVKSIVQSKVGGYNHEITSNTVFSDDFSEGLGQWESLDNSDPQIMTEENGNKYAQLTNDSMIHLFRGGAGTYTVSFDWRSTDQGSYSFTLYDKDFNAFENDLELLGNTSDNQWHTYTKKYKVSDMATMASITFGQNIDIDNVSVVRE